MTQEEIWEQERIHDYWYEVAKREGPAREQEIRLAIRAFREEVGKSFAIACRKNYLELQIEEMSNRFHELKQFCATSRSRALSNIIHGPELMSLAARIKKFKAELLNLYAGNEQTISEQDILRANTADMSQFFDKSKTRNQRTVVSCIFHNEKTPSMVIYKENGFHCFGCGKSGDNITLYRELFHVDFKQAVKELLRYV